MRTPKAKIDSTYDPYAAHECPSPVRLYPAARTDVPSGGIKNPYACGRTAMESERRRRAAGCALLNEVPQCASVEMRPSRTSRYNQVHAARSRCACDNSRVEMFRSSLPSSSFRSRPLASTTGTVEGPQTVS